MQIQKMTVIEIQKAVKDGTIPKGAMLCFWLGERALLNGLIRHVQKGALRDLGEDRRGARHYSNYTHIGVVNSVYGIIDHYWPKTRKVDWEALVGRRILIRKVKDIDTSTSLSIAHHARMDVVHESKYEISDLFSFYFYWKCKVLRKLNFHTLFDSRDRDVCSTRYVVWCERARAMALSKYGEKWSFYPAHLACSSKWEDVAEIELVP